MNDKPSITANDTSDPNCKRCDGTGWVCENHHHVPWAGMTGEAMCRSGVEGCGGAGDPCPDCNELSRYTSPPLSDTLTEAGREKLG